jgi:hypothetical protein
MRANQFSCCFAGCQLRKAAFAAIFRPTLPDAPPELMSDSLFCILTLMALVTTAMTTPLLLWWMKGTELRSAHL